MNTLSELIRIGASRSNGNVAITAPGRPPVSYDRLLSTAEYVRNTLRHAGVGPSDRVAVIAPNGPEMAALFLALAACTSCAPLNPAYRESELDFYLDDLGARALVIDSRVDSPARVIAENRGIAVIELISTAVDGTGIFALDVTTRVDDPTQTGGEPAPSDTALLLHTSGTTSRPKLVPLTHANLFASARSIAASLHLDATDRVLNIMPLFHIHGLVGATLASVAVGASVACPPAFQPSLFFEWLDELEPTWYSGVPTMHQSILGAAPAHRDIIARRPLRFIRSSSAALPPSVSVALETAFGAPVIEAYGMTEASHQMASNPLPPGERRPGTVGRSAGADIAIAAADGTFLEPGEPGEILIRGPGVTAGYEANPAANEQAFVGGWLRTGDEGVIDADGYLTITGRTKEIVNRGGEKIAPREVEEALLEHPAVAEAAVFAIPHARLGEEVAAAVVLRSADAATSPELRRFTANRLADFKVPRRIVLLDEIPRGATGKIQRVGLGAKLGLAGNPRTEMRGAAPRSPTEETLCDIVAEVLDLDEVGVDNDFFDMGGDSIQAVQIVDRIRSAFGVAVPAITLFDAPTVAELAVVVLQARAEGTPLDELLTQLESMSEDEAARLLEDLPPEAPR